MRLLANPEDPQMMRITQQIQPLGFRCERDLRPEKTKEKVSLMFRSWNGIKNHVKIRSFISTAKKRRLDLFSAITKVNNGIEVLRRA